MSHLATTWTGKLREGDGDAAQLWERYFAQLVGVADRLGSVEKGKSANLVLATGDILQA